MELRAENTTQALKTLNFKLTPDLQVVNDAEESARREGLGEGMVAYLQQRKLSHALDAGASEDPLVRSSFRGRMREIDELLGLLKRD